MAANTRFPTSPADAVQTGLDAITSISASSAIAPGTPLDGGACHTTATMVVTSSAGVTAGAVQLQGSLDGSNWYNLGSAVSTTSASTTFPPVSTTGTLVRYVRASITTIITGGTISAVVGMAG